MRTSSKRKKPFRANLHGQPPVETRRPGAAEGAGAAPNNSPTFSAGKNLAAGAAGALLEAALRDFEQTQAREAVGFFFATAAQPGSEAARHEQMVFVWPVAAGRIGNHHRLRHLGRQSGWGEASNAVKTFGRSG
jgi:hypothetical protein